MKRTLTIFLLLLSFNSFCGAQVINVYKPFPTDTSSITVYFHADQGNKGLMNFKGSVYLHTGVITSQSTSPTNWKHVVTTSFNTPNPAWKLTKISANLYSYKINNIRSFYQATTDTSKFLKLAFVFRDSVGDNNKKGTNADGSDVLYSIFPAGENVAKFFSPSNPPVLLQPNDQYSCTFQTSLSSSITIYDNGSPIQSYSNKDSVTFIYTATTFGSHLIKGVATNGSSMPSDSFYFAVRGPVVYAPLPTGSKIGINYLNDSTVRLVLVAPHKKYVFVIGEFNNWQVDLNYYMNHTPDSIYWWVDITGLKPGTEYAYQYYIDGVMSVADQYADKVLDPYNDQYIPAATYPNLKPFPKGNISGEVSILETGQTPYPWKVNNFVKPNTNSMVIYELWIEDFITQHSWSVLKDSLDYLKRLGVNAIELLPFNEFEGNIGLGYNPNFYFAPDKYFGPKDSLKKFIDICHQNGIAVIQDLAMNDCFGSAPYAQMYWDTLNQRPAANNPWFNTVPTHAYNVGNDFNHESPFTKKYFTDITRYWLGEYKIDGFRFDLAKGYTQTKTDPDVGKWAQYDQSRINIWKGYSDSIKSYFPDAIMILEYFTDNSEETVLANYGLLIWGNEYTAYQQAAMGYNTNWDLSGSVYRNLGWTYPNQVTAMETHDQERVMFKVEQYGNATTTYSTKDTATGLARIALCANLFFTIPGPDMVWEFAELGFDYSINWKSPTNTTGGSNNDAKPIRWDYYSNPDRYRLFRVYAELINLKKTQPVFSTSTFNSSLYGPYKEITLTDPSMDAIAYGNFAVTSATYGVNFPHTGTWYNFYDQKVLDVTNTSMNIAMQPGEYKLYTDQKLPLPDLGLTADVDNIDMSKDQVFDVYPNPANSNSSITVYISSNEDVKLDIYDLSGKHISTVFDEKKVQKGFYTASLSSLGLSSGTYILKLTNNSGATSQKLIIQ